MIDEMVIRRWKVGLSKFTVAKEYMQEYNKEAVRKGEKKINKDQALAHVEPIIFEHETKDWRRKNEV